MTNDVVKSVGRVLDVLELFQRERRSMKANDVCIALGYPKSSANALLKSMVQLGYLSFDIDTLGYFPTIRVHSLGDWLPAALLGDEHTNLLRELHDRTSETAMLSVRNGFNMQFVSVIPGKFAISLSIQDGFLAPMLGSAVGAAYMATLSEGDLDKLQDRASRATVELAAGVTWEGICNDIVTTKKRGYALAYNRVTPDCGAIAMVLPDSSATRPLIVGIVGLSTRMRRAEKGLIEAMTSLVSN
ncbi:MAG: helix-turn-helix domain-containing protein [Rhodospirillaceae bacterium]|nr:helix-turn-helix domain-containing protein [Rhodospirillaceae bacterium]